MISYWSLIKTGVFIIYSGHNVTSQFVGISASIVKQEFIIKVSVLNNSVPLIVIDPLLEYG